MSKFHRRASPFKCYRCGRAFARGERFKLKKTKTGFFKFVCADTNKCFRRKTLNIANMGASNS